MGFLDIYCLFGVCSRGLLEFSWSRPCSFLFVNLLFVEVEMHIFFLAACCILFHFLSQMDMDKRNNSFQFNEKIVDGTVHVIG